MNLAKTEDGLSDNIDKCQLKENQAIFNCQKNIKINNMFMN
jgi:hypothetical protein